MVLAGAHAGPEQLARFLAEAQAVAHLQHPGIVQIFDVGETLGLPFLSLEYADGGSLEQKIAGRPQPPRQAAALMETLARAVQAAHQAGVVHRDLKPANVLLTADGSPKITDFGLAKRLETDSSQTRSGTIMGTPSYMSPEQAWGNHREIGPLSDLYSLGAIFYQLLTGRPPFQGTTLLETLEQVRTQEPVSPTRLQPKIPRDLETICLKCLQKEPRQRYASALAFAADLRRFLDGEAILARPVSGPERMVRWCRRKPMVATLTAFVVVLILGFMTTSLAFNVLLAEQKRATEAQRDAARTARARADENAAVAERRAEEARAARIRADENAAIADKHAAVAKKNAQLASGQMRLALEALKALVTGVQNELRDRPGMQVLRKRLVEVATTKLDQVARMAQGFDLSEQGPAQDEDVQLYLRALAGAHQRMAETYLDAGLTDKALEHYRRCHEIIEKVFRDRPDDPVAKRNLAAVTNNLADFRRDQLGDLNGALELYRRALALRLEWAKLQPQDDGARQAVSNSYGLVGGVLLRRGDPAGALPLYRESQRWRESISREYASQVVEVQREWAGTHDKLGEIRFKLGESKAARAEYEKARDIRQELVGGTPDTISATRDLALSCENLGDVLLLLEHDPVAARAEYERACNYLETLWKQDPENTQTRLALAHADYKLATAQLRCNDPKSAGERFRASLDRLEPMAATGQHDARRDVDLMLALARCGRHAEAANLARTLASAGQTSAEISYQVACGYALCAHAAPETSDANEPPHGVGGPEPSYADLAIGSLRRCLELGWKDLVTVQVDPDLDPIRQHPDFEKVLEDLKSQSRSDAKSD